MFKLLKKFFGFSDPPPKWRLIPNDSGTYTLEKWNSDINTYIAESVRVTPEEADECIKNLERDKMYYRENHNEA